MNLGDLLDRGAIAPRVSAASKRQALSVIAEIAARQHGLKAPEVFDALVEREAAGSTGVGHGVAIPHARLAGLTKLRAVFVRLEQPVEFDAVDGQPVDLLFALFGPKEGGSEHLRALARASRLLRGAEMREQLRKASTPDALRALLVAEAPRSAA
jgi:PTS system nitrogen regulatory IIA component